MITLLFLLDTNGLELAEFEGCGNREMNETCGDAEEIWRF